MTTLSKDTAVGEFVAVRPSNARIFERLGVDYCCGGKMPLEEACRLKGLDAEAVFASLTDDAAEAETGEADPSLMSLTELADHIEQKHHRRFREELPRIEFLINKVAAAHGTSYPWIHPLKIAFDAIGVEMLQHMAKEEQDLFPVIRRLEEASPVPSSMWSSLQAPIQELEAEHDNAGQAMETMRRLTNNYTPPPGACNTFRAMLDALAEVELDLHVHVHKENHILFPRALARGRREVAV